MEQLTEEYRDQLGEIENSTEDADSNVTIANATDSWGESYGYDVKMEHGGGLTTGYIHCSSICVTMGQQMLAGQVVAYLGCTGRATGSHLHWEVY